MTSVDFNDHSSTHTSAVPHIATASNLVLIDNYDSFTWNVFQYLCLEGASVNVYRNDEITLRELIDLAPSQIIISPGPGHPDTDSGISKEAIRHFSGKVPVLGICMGEQCIYSVFGGQVEVAGQILHGKTSPLRHDSKGLFAGIAQGIPVTRYHSLAGTHPSLPESLEVSSWVASDSEDEKGIIMGVRHRELLVEGVQFHPESILTAEGRTMLKNFLRMRGGTWKENEKFQSKSSNGIFTNKSNRNSNQVESPIVNGVTVSKTSGERKESILEQIFVHRRAAVEVQMQLPSQTLYDLQMSYNLNVSPPQISFTERLRISPFTLSLMAEIKRASPSKGTIISEISAAKQAQKYALAGASVISVLTEPHWFKGSIEDLRAVRQSLEGMPQRPAILRKEFIFNEYQILEGRLSGCDSVLLIVKMLDEETLKKLYLYSQSLGMEPLVETNTIDEMKIAMRLGAKVVGVNNRNLNNFEVDLETTSRLMGQVSKETIVCALSGISGPDDVRAYQTNGVSAVLVGEALMRADDPTSFADRLLGRIKEPKEPKNQSGCDVCVKICGTRSLEAAKAAVEAGADLIGMILVPSRKRCVQTDVAIAISEVVHKSQKPGLLKSTPLDETIATGFFDHTTTFFRRSDRALLVGVFQNQPLSYVIEQQRLLDLDVVQLHGSEPIEWASLIPVPVIRRFGPSDEGLGRRGYHALPLLDSATGGTGKKLNAHEIESTLNNDNALRVVLAGGLDPDNVSGILREFVEYSEQIVCVDVSSGVEDNGAQSLDKIRKFIKAAKSAPRSWK